ncbi:KH domain-containing protein [Striga asiatica]|uniref:KH domain-containing protein n=1 Tax=Striga asiatica TaxID=4170 RepID=A0A5A7P4G5_STRAF|nr:KH domain-containing protein [Striga asiatica]
MADRVIASSEDGQVASAAAAAAITSDSAAADSHKRKLDDLELSNAAEPVAEAEDDNPETLNDGTQAEESEGAESKRPRLESNGDNVTEAEDEAEKEGNVQVSQNGHQEEEKRDEPAEVEPENLESALANVEPLENQEPPKEPNDQEPSAAPVETIVQEPTPDENEKTELGSYDELGQPNAENEEPSELPREGDVPVHSAERGSNSGRQILSRKMEVPSDKVGVLIGKAGDTIRSLQDNSGAKIQIMRDADADPRSTSRPVELVGTLEDINKAEKLIKGVIAEADAGGSPSLVARGFNTVQAASGGEQVEIQVPIEKVGLIIGKGGETIRNLQTRSRARIQLIQQNLSDGEQPKERIVRISGYRRQIDTAREMIKDVMNQFALPSWCINRQPLSLASSEERFQALNLIIPGFAIHRHPSLNSLSCVATVRPSPVSGGYSQQGYRPPHGPTAPQWGPRGGSQYSGYDYPQRGAYPPQNSQYPPPSYGSYHPPPRSNFGPSWDQRPPTSMHGPSPQGNYNYGQQVGPDYGHPPPYSQPYSHGYEAKYEKHAPPQHYGPQPTPYSQQSQYGKPPMYGMMHQPPHSQPYGQPRPSQPGEGPYHGQNIQQSYPYPSSGPTQQTCYGSAPTSDGYGHPHTTAAAGSGYGPPVAYSQPGAQQQQPAYPQAGPTGGYGSYQAPQPGGYAEQPPAAAATNNAAGYGYHQGQPDPAAYQGPTAAYPATGVGQAGYAQPQPQPQPQPGYDQSAGYGNVPAQAPPQYDATTQMYGGNR